MICPKCGKPIRKWIEGWDQATIFGEETFVGEVYAECGCGIEHIGSTEE
jgi:hypothetical protein